MSPESSIQVRMRHASVPIAEKGARFPVGRPDPHTEPMLNGLR